MHNQVLLISYIFLFAFIFFPLFSPGIQSKHLFFLGEIFFMFNKHYLDVHV
jgi:hypothetical protein